MFGLSPAGKKNTANPGGGAIVGVSGTGVNPGRPALTLRERRELVRRLQVDLLEQRVIALERPAVGAEVVAVVADAVGAPNGRTTVVGRVGEAETRRPAAVEVRRQRPAIVVGGRVNQPVLQAEVGLPVVLLDGSRQQVPAQAEIERQIARDAEIVLHEEADEIDEHLGVGVHEVTLHAVGKTEQEARPRLTGVRRAEVARVVAIEGEEPTRLRLRVGQRRLDEPDVTAELHRVLVEHPCEVVRELHASCRCGPSW